MAYVVKKTSAHPPPISARKDPVEILALQIHAEAENRETDEITESHFFGIAERRKLVPEKERDSDH
jgi:hypothetical protein